jgi:hypothetical protein
LLQWYGIPKARWGLGERVAHAPTFEAICQQAEARNDAPAFTPPYDKLFPRDAPAIEGAGLHDLHRLMAPRLIWSLVQDRMSVVDYVALTDSIMSQASDLKTLHGLIEGLSKQR